MRRVSGGGSVRLLLCATVGKADFRKGELRAAPRTFPSRQPWDSGCGGGEGPEAKHPPPPLSSTTTARIHLVNFDLELHSIPHFSTITDHSTKNPISSARCASRVSLNAIIT